VRSVLGVSNDVTSKIIDKRDQNGQCSTCGIQTHNVSRPAIGRPIRTPLNTSGVVINGRCLMCHPLEWTVLSPPCDDAPVLSQYPEGNGWPPEPCDTEVGASQFFGSPTAGQYSRTLSRPPLNTSKCSPQFQIDTNIIASNNLNYGLVTPITSASEGVDSPNQPTQSFREDRNISEKFISRYQQSLQSMSSSQAQGYTSSRTHPPVLLSHTEQQENFTAPETCLPSQKFVCKKVQASPLPSERHSQNLDEKNLKLIKFDENSIQPADKATEKRDVTDSKESINEKEGIRQDYAEEMNKVTSFNRNTNNVNPERNMKYKQKSKGFKWKNIWDSAGRSHVKIDEFMKQGLKGVRQTRVEPVDHNNCEFVPCDNISSLKEDSSKASAETGSQTRLNSAKVKGGEAPDIVSAHEENSTEKVIKHQEDAYEVNEEENDKTKEVLKGLKTRKSEVVKSSKIDKDVNLNGANDTYESDLSSEIFESNSYESAIYDSESSEDDVLDTFHVEDAPMIHDYESDIDEESSLKRFEKPSLSNHNDISKDFDIFLNLIAVNLTSELSSAFAWNGTDLEAAELFKPSWFQFGKADLKNMVEVMASKCNNYDIALAGCLKFCELSQNKATCTEIVENSGIHVLILLLYKHMTHTDIQRHGIGALLNLAISIECKDKIVKAGGVHVILLSMISHPDHNHILKVGLGALYNLAKVQKEGQSPKSKEDKVKHTLATETVLQSLKFCKAHWNIPEANATALRYLSQMDKADVNVILKNDDIHLVTHSEYSFQQIKIFQDHMLACLWHWLDESYSTCNVSGGIDQALTLIATHKLIGDVQECAITLLWTIARGNFLNQVNIALKDGIRVILYALMQYSENLCVQAQGLWLLYNLAKDNTDVQEAILEARALDVITLGMEKHDHNSFIQKIGWETIWILGLDFEKNIRSLYDSEFQQILFCMRKFPYHGGLQDIGCRFLHDMILSRNLNPGKKLVQDCIGDVVMAMRRHSGIVRLQKHACIMMEILLSYSPTNQKKISEFDGISTVLGCMLKFSGDAYLQELALAVLMGLVSGNDENKNAVEELGGIEAIVKAMKTHLNAVHVQGNGCRALWLLAANNHVNKISIASAKGIDAIAKAMETYPFNTTLQKKACGALWSLSFYNARNQAYIIKCNGLALILKAMQSHQDNSSLQEQALGALLNLMSKNQENQFQLAAECGVEVIISSMLFHKKKSTLQERACEVLWVVSTSEKLQVQISNEGGISAVRKAMKEHYNILEVQEKGLWVFRNLARNLKVRKTMKQMELGSTILKAKKRFPNKCSANAEELLSILGCMDKEEFD